jgi:RNA polymerase sigma-70 factor (ECF subfamily)
VKDPSNDHLFLLAYDLLRAQARALFAKERKDHTLQPTSLVHEVYLRLRHATSWQGGEEHLRAVAVRAMREVLVDHARATLAKRRDRRRRSTFDGDTPDLRACAPELVIDLDDGLKRLDAIDPNLAAVALRRVFGGANVPEVAAELGRPEWEVYRQWRTARAWLVHFLDAARTDDAEDTAGRVGG